MEDFKRGLLIIEFSLVICLAVIAYIGGMFLVPLWGPVWLLGYMARVQPQKYVKIPWYLAMFVVAILSLPGVPFVYLCTWFEFYDA